MLSDNIKNLRKQKGYTQETLAQALNIVRQTVSKWEKGYSVPDADMLEKLSEVLEVPVSELLGKPSGAPEQASELEKISAQLAIINEQLAREMARRKRNRKIGLGVALSLLVLFIIGTFLVFHAFGIEVGVFPGNVDHVEERYVESSLYSQNDIDDAINVIKNDFAYDWDGCVLTLIYYGGDERCKQESEERGVETIVLLSDFDTRKQPGDSSLNSYDTYTGWSWILVRDEDGGWKHIDHGYG